MSNIKRYGKLVRDKIPEIIEKNGGTPITHILNDEEYIEELNTKLLEETKEYLESFDVEELADMYEVILAILNAKNVSVPDFEKIRIGKVDKRGSFKDRIYLEAVNE